MKLCYFGDGQSVHVKKWCVHFSNLGYEVHLITFRNTTITNVTVHFINAGDIRSKGGNWKTLLQFRKIRTLLKKINPDIFHAHYATSYGITAALVNFQPFIISTWGSDILIAPKRSWILKQLIKWALRKSDAVTVVAEHMVKNINELSVKNDKIHVITHGIDVQLFKNKSLERYHDFTLVCNRGLEPIYNHKTLIETFEIIKALKQNIKLIIVGDGSLRAEIEETVKQKDLNSIISFTGQQTQLEMVDVLNKTHLYISLSKSDGDVVSMVEAMSCGNFCIGSDIAGNRNWITDSINGCLVPLFDPQKIAKTIIDVKNNYEQYQQEAAPINAEIVNTRGNWNSNMNSALSIYKTLIHKK
jgi:L-malate glycosyltransferase